MSSALMFTKSGCRASFYLYVVGACCLANPDASAATATVTIGQRVTLGVTANGTAPFSYQWRKDGANISGATSSAYTIASATSLSAGNYTAVVSNSAGSTTSDTATLIVSTATAAPRITTQPASRSVAAGQSASFSVVASGTSPLRYQWRRNGTAISGATNATYTITSTTTASAGTYSVVVSNSVGSVTSVNATLVVTTTTQPGGLVAAYALEEGSGTRAGDSSSFRNNGVLRSATWTTAGKFGRALSFNGGDAYVEVLDSSSLDLTSGMTLEAWVYPTSLSGSREVLYKDRDLFYLRGSTSTDSRPAIAGSFSSTTLRGPSSLPLNTWSHLAATYDGATLRLYVNGAQVATHAQTGAIRTSNGLLSIGGDPVYGRFWQGRIDEIRIYNRALSQAELQRDMNTAITTTTAQSQPQATQTMAALSQPAAPASGIVNTSSRLLVSSGERTPISGFVVDGSRSRTMLIRGIGPGLSSLGVDGGVAQPVLRVFSGSDEIASNQDWTTGNAGAIRDAAGSVGAFALSGQQADSALLLDLRPGAYTVQLTDASSTEGTGMIEVYEVDAAGATELTNFSTRAFVEASAPTLINGIVVAGASPQTVLVRAVGPGLRTFGVSEVLPRPVLSAHAADGTQIATNTGWGNGPAEAIAAATREVGAFALPEGSDDSALLVRLAPGAYTFLVEGRDRDSGVVLLEMYRMPAKQPSPAGN